MVKIDLRDPRAELLQIIKLVGGDRSAAPPQTLDDWTSVYDGLSPEDIEAIDSIANSRANLTREMP